jgi:hypothetical protein
MRAFQYKLCVTLGIVLMCVPGGTWAQQQGQDQGQPQDEPQARDQAQAPIPAYRSPLASLGNETNPGPQDLEPDRQPLAGAQILSLGIPESHTYWQPSANVTSNAISNGLGNSTGWANYTNLTGGLVLHDTSGRSNLALSYLGGGAVSSDGGINGVIQELGLAENLSWERTTLSFFEQASYLPETGFGYGGIGGLALPGGSPAAPQPDLGVNGTILTTRGSQLNESSLVQMDTKLSPLSSVTFLGGYALLHFFGTNLLNTSSTVFQAGYNRDLTPKDTVAVLYRFNALRFGNNSQSVNDNLAQFSYARRVTGRLAFQATAGPEISLFSTPVLTGSASSGPPSSTLLNWAASTSLSFQLEQSLLAMSYSHGVTGGAGVFMGALGDTVTGSVSHQFVRTMGAMFVTGFARNRALAIPGSATVNQTYDYWFGEATLNHPLGRTMNLALSYEESYQSSNFAFCTGPTCATSLNIHQVSLGLSWQAAPIVF